MRDQPKKDSDSRFFRLDFLELISRPPDYPGTLTTTQSQQQQHQNSFFFLLLWALIDKRCGQFFFSYPELKKQKTNWSRFFFSFAVGLVNVLITPFLHE
jgi:hypothetical protein